MIEICEIALQKFPGNIVEIGAGLGETTKLLLKLAEKYDRKVIVIDPFEHGWKDMPESYGKPYTLEKFNSNVTEHRDRLVIHQLSSLSWEAWEICGNEEIAFAYVDGLQYFGAVINDLFLTDHAGVVCVDDYNRSTGQSQVPKAIEQFIDDANRTLTIKDRWAILT